MPASTPSNRPTRLSVSVSVSVLPNAFFISPMRPPFPLSSLRSSALVFALPTAKPEMAAAEKMPKWSLSAIKSFALAEVEARRLKYPTAGTEALLMGILVEGTNDASRFLHANGITLFKVREETVKLLGKSDLFFVSPEEIPLTESAQRALDKAIDEKLKSDLDCQSRFALFGSSPHLLMRENLLAVGNWTCPCHWAFLCPISDVGEGVSSTGQGLHVFTSMIVDVYEKDTEGSGEEDDESNDEDREEQHIRASVGLDPTLNDDVEEDINLVSKNELKFFETLVKNKKNDLEILYSNAKIYSFDEEDEVHDDERAKRTTVKKERPLYLKDVNAWHLIEDGPEFEDEPLKYNSKVYNEGIKAFLEAEKASFAAEGGDLEKPDFDKEDELLDLPKGWDDDAAGSGKEGFEALKISCDNSLEITVGQRLRRQLGTSLGHQTRDTVDRKLFDTAIQAVKFCEICTGYDSRL
ncbi:hypothetical protein ZIOFF_073121 [Zingiber officinale]|uniref:Clp R domain-containing protein n=1 Tax=Zingiber officinale TaxID=94328 RepID=A0A8J5EP22_ZINOF|nr:hypothetical protein ZIOFF_073121 [Zingiber officinale]